MKRYISFLTGTCLILTLSGCFGGFNLTKNVYDMNDRASDNGFVKSVLMVGMLIIPIYEIAAIGDLLIFNTIEFWSGENPIAMEDGERRRQVIEMDGKIYTVEAIKDKFIIRPNENPLAGHVIGYDRENEVWAYLGPEN